MLEFRKKLIYPKLHENVKTRIGTFTQDTVIYTSVKIIENEVGCRDDTVPKTVETKRHCEED